VHWLDAEQFALVREAVALHGDWRHRIAEAHPIWHLGLPGWEDDVIALQLDAGPGSLLALWSRGTETEITLPGLRGRTIEQVYPVALPEWKIRTDEGLPVLEVPAGPAARIFAVR
jgi:alpha-galactosidase